MKKHYKTAVIGATFLGIGVALAEEDVLLISEDVLLGAEFIDSYRISKVANSSGFTANSNCLLNEMIDRKLIAEDGSIYAGPISFIMGRMLLEKNIDVLMMTKFIDYVSCENGFEITIFNEAGYQTIKTDKIVDTVFSEQGLPDGTSAKKTLNAIAYNPTKSFLNGLQYNSANNLFVYSMETEFGCERSSAVNKYYDMKKSFSDSNLHITSIAGRFDYFFNRPIKKEQNGVLWVPSISYEDPISAFDAGICLFEKRR